MKADQFTDKFLRDNNVVTDYKKAQDWSSGKRFLGIYFLFSVLGIVINNSLKSITNINTTIYGIDNLPMFLMVGVGILISFLIVVASNDKIKSTGLQNKDIVYHLAESLDGFREQPEPNYSKIMASLNNCVEYIEDHQVAYAHPRIEQAFQEYVYHLKGYETPESRNKFISESFEIVLDPISESILNDESIDFELDTDTSVPPDEDDSSIKFIFRIISEFFTERRVQLLF